MWTYFAAVVEQCTIWKSGGAFAVARRLPGGDSCARRGVGRETALCAAGGDPRVCGHVSWGGEVDWHEARACLLVCWHGTAGAVPTNAV